jgi:RNA polymerase sigma-70 factor (ECF subfamily)
MSGSTDLNERNRRFEAIWADLKPDLYRYAFWLMRDRALAEDVLQETLLRAWKSLDALQDEASAKSWLITILRRENARMYERKRLETVDVDALSGREQLELSPEADGRLEDMREAIFALSDEYREPLVLQVLMGYTTEEIAQQLGLSGNAVLTRLFRARKQLKSLLGQD